MSQKLKGTTEVYNGYFKMLEATVETSNGETVKRELFSRASRGNSDDGVAAIVYDTKKQKYIFTKQFRVGLYLEDDMEIVEAVAGTLKEGEDPQECMIREIEEELGYATDNIKPIGVYYVSPGGCAEKLYVYEAYVSEKVSDGGGLAEEHEEIETIEMTLQEMKDFTFTDAKTMIGVQKVIHDDMPNIYDLLDKIDFEEQAKQMREAIIRHNKMGLEGEALDFNTNQVAFSLLQKFYDEVLKHNMNEK
jgi:ADP-ribose pyrophosphatase